MLEPSVSIVLLTLSAFVSTSIDNLVMLTLILAQPVQRRLSVLVGYAGAAALIGVGGLGVARVADAVPPTLAGYLGLIPLGLGLRKLWAVYRPRPAVGESPQAPVQAVGAAAVMGLMLANGSDTMAVLLPLFAETPEPLTYLMAGTIVVVAVGWFGLAVVLGAQPLLRQALQRVERWFLPVLLIGMGLYVLADTATDTLPG